MMDNPFTPALTYRYPAQALEWLQQAFGFETSMIIESPDDDPASSHYEMSIGGKGRIMFGGEWADWSRSPQAVNGFNTSSVHVSLDTNIDEHYERARAAGATILVEPSDQFYGDRVYRCADLEGHHWTFSTHVRDVTIEEAEVASGTKITATNWQ